MKRKLLTAVVLILLCLGMYGGYRHHMLNIVVGGWTFGPENALPPMLMAEGTVYVLYEETDTIPDGQPDGWTDRHIGNEIPTENGQVNSGIGQTVVPYWFTEDGVCVRIGNDTFYTGHPLENQE